MSPVTASPLHAAGAPPLILASGSASRRRMLEAAGVPFTIETLPVDEEAITAALIAEGLGAPAIADALAEAKALRVSAKRPGALVLGGDSVIVCEGRLWAKPETRARAHAQLQALAGRTHTLISAAVIAENSVPVWRHGGEAELTIRPLGDAFITRYLDAAGEAVLGSVGAYHTEGLGAQLFSAIRGDWFTILGLPLLAVLDYLRTRGVLLA